MNGRAQVLSAELDGKDNGSGLNDGTVIFNGSGFFDGAGR